MLVESDLFADTRGQQLPRLTFRMFIDAVERFRPGMVGQGTFRVVIGQNSGGTEVTDGRRQFAGQGVDIVPSLVVLPVLHNGEVDTWVFLPNLLKASVLNIQPQPAV